LPLHALQQTIDRKRSKARRVKEAATPSDGSGGVWYSGGGGRALIVAALVLIVFGDRLALSGDGATTT